MGFHPLPSLRQYWSCDKNFRVDRIADLISQKRFLQILRFLHINDNNNMPKRGEPNFDKLYKIRPLIENINKNFKELFTPYRRMSVDESMVGFKGRTSLKQYMPMKPTKRGIKVWALACSKTGYMTSFQIYQGKEDTLVESTLGERVVLQLCAPYFDKGYCLYFDNFFSTFSLLDSLLKKKTFACGTFRINRKFYPKTLLKNDKEMKVGDSDFAQAGDYSVVKWRDRGKKSVNVISSMHNPQDLSTVKRTNKMGVREEVNCPESIADYNRYMGGVDKFDQYHSTYSISWKSRKWWVKLFYYFIDCSIVNSYILYKESVPKKEKPISHLKFRTILADELIAAYNSRKRRGPLMSGDKKIKKLGGRGVSIENIVRRNNLGDHLPIKGTSRRCSYCSTAKKTKRSQIICRRCEVALCLECFAPFHEK